MFKKKNIRQTFSSLTVRNYRLFFFGQVISTTGTWMQVLGQAWLVLKLTGSGTALGFVVALQFLPVLFVGAWAGVVVDRFPRRNLLLVTQFAAGILAGILGLLVATDAVVLWHVYALALGLGLVNALDNPARQSFITEMVNKEHLTSAVSLNSIQLNLTRVLGPALAAVLIASTGLASLFVSNALSYIAVIIALLLMKREHLYIVPTIPVAKGQLAEGLRYVRNSPIIVVTLLMMAIIGTLTYEFTVSLPLFAQVTLNGTATTYAKLSAALGIGSIIGAISTANRKHTNGMMLIRAAFLFGLAVIFFSLAPVLWVALILLLVVGYFSVCFLSLGNIILQMETLPEMRGRVMGLWAVAYLGSTPIGGPTIGWISETFSPRWGLAVGGIAAISAGILGAVVLKSKLLKKETTDIV